MKMSAETMCPYCGKKCTIQTDFDEETFDLYADGSCGTFEDKIVETCEACGEDFVVNYKLQPIVVIRKIAETEEGGK